MNDYQDYLNDHTYEDLPTDIRAQVDAATYEAEQRAWRAAQAFWREVPSPPPTGADVPTALTAAVRCHRLRRRLPNWVAAAGFLLCFALGGWLFSGASRGSGPTEPRGMATDTVYLERERIVRDTVRLPGREVPVPVLVERTDTVYVPLAEPEPVYAVATESGSDSLLWQFLVPAR
jgi:hypothetical protein